MFTLVSSLTCFCYSTLTVRFKRLKLPKLCGTNMLLDDLLFDKDNILQLSQYRLVLMSLLTKDSATTMDQV